MGIIIGRLRRKKSTYEVLEKLDHEIKSIEEFRRSTELTHKKIVGRFILVSVFVYLVTAVIFYFYFFPPSMYERLIYVIPLVFAPVVIISVKKILTWYYNRKLKKNHDKLVKLREEKKKMLDTVMETETYKVAKNILEKFAPEQVRKSMYGEATPASKALTPVMPSSVAPPTGLRYRGSFQPPSMSARHSIGGPTAMMATPVPTRSLLPPPTSVLSRQAQTTQVVPQSVTRHSPGRPQTAGAPGSTSVVLPRGILARDRTVLDKMVDYLVGDGPSNRYALICKQCSSHNGMALKEEFEYLSYRCCYCNAFNPARKQRPAAPKLELEIRTPIKAITKTDTSESERASSSDTDTSSEVENRQNNEESKPTLSGSDSPDIKMSDIDKLSDIEFNLSGSETVPMEIDSSISHTVETEDVSKDKKVVSAQSGVEDVIESKTEETAGKTTQD